MKVSPFDNLPLLSKEDALAILAKPISELELASDYYKAVFHLQKYPGVDTEKVLLALIESDIDEQPVAIARRKAVEGLARLRCHASIPAIGRCLKSSDPYLVEIAAWALKELDCKDRDLINEIASLLDDPIQNRRVLIQSLTGLGAVSEVPRIKVFVEDKNVSPGVRGASIAAISKLCGERTRLKQLEEYLALPSQNDRQCAVQDVIDAGDISLLPSVLQAPVAPSFRLRAIYSLWPTNVVKYKELNLFSLLDSLILDSPDDIEVLHSYSNAPSNEFLVEELFCTDFSRCYLALKTLKSLDFLSVLPLILQNLDRFQKDYGAIYFLIILFRELAEWPCEGSDRIENFLFSALNNNWPQYMKFRPAAIITLMKFSPDKCRRYIEQWLDENQTLFWASRYATLMSVSQKFHCKGWDFLMPLVMKSKDDVHRFVRLKANNLINEF